MADKFKKGDIVRLKSGGPTMTINGKSQREKDLYTCIWFQNPPHKDDPQYRDFDEDVLELDNETD